MHRVPSSAENPYPAGKPPSVKQGKNQNDTTSISKISSGNIRWEKINKLEKAGGSSSKIFRKRKGQNYG